MSSDLAYGFDELVMNTASFDEITGNDAVNLLDSLGGASLLHASARTRSIVDPIAEACKKNDLALADARKKNDLALDKISKESQEAEDAELEREQLHGFQLGLPS